MILRRARAGRDCGLPLWLLLLIVAALSSAGCSHKGADDYLREGDEAMQSAHLSEAENDYQQAAKIAPNDARPHLALGSLYVFERKPQQAENELMKALELQPSNARAHAMLASAYADQSELGLAEAQGRAAVALDSAKADYRMSLGTILQREQKLSAAEAEYRTAIGLAPRNPHSHLALATLLNAEPERQNEAQAEYARVKALDPSLVPATSSATATLAVRTRTASAISPTPQAPAIKEANKRFLLTRDSPVYESMSQGGRVVAQVHRRKYVHVTGMGGQWLRIQLRNGTIGYIPATAAE
jgi:tetratricopeptide (TPR) repeat protein